MNNQIYEISAHFGISPKSIGKSKYFNILHSKGGVYSLCSARPSPEKIMFLHDIKENLIENGFYFLDRYITTDENLPYYICDDITYTMTEFHGTNELDFLNNVNCLKSVSAIGKMHRASVSVQPAVPLISQYENGIEKLNKIKRKVSAKKYPSDMDLLFRKTINTAEECAKTAVDILNKNDFNNTKAIYIHNSLKEDNIIINNGKIYIIDWDNACVGSPMADLAFFIRRYIRKNAYYSHLSDENYISLSEFLTAYQKQNNLSDKENEILHALLIYPSRYINVMEDIYKKQRCFIPTSLSAKAEEITKQWEFTSNYISHGK